MSDNKKVIDFASKAKVKIEEEKSVEEQIERPELSDEDITGFLRTILHLLTVSDSAEIRTNQNDLMIETRNYTGYYIDDSVESGQCISLLSSIPWYHEDESILTEEELIARMRLSLNSVDAVEAIDDEEV